MDNLTHSLVGALIGQAGLKKKTGLAMPALILGANLPDVDAACLLWLPGVEHLAFRRGITHGPPALVLLPLILAALLYGFDRWQSGRGKRPEGRLPVSFGWLFLLALIGCLTHPALDWLNVYGIRLLEPFSHQWFYGDTLFIIDVWLWALMGFSLWFSLRKEKRSSNWTRPAQIAIAASFTYILASNAFSVGAYQRAMDDPAGAMPRPTRVIVSPPPLAPWSREILAMDSNQRWYTYNYSLFTGADEAIQLAPDQCGVDVRSLPILNRQVAAFLFWSRAPFTEAAPDGSIILRDARFYDPRARDRFSVALPEVKCQRPETE